MNKYYIKQKLSGAVIAVSGILTPILDNWDITFTLFALPLGIYLIGTKAKVMDFNGK